MFKKPSQKKLTSKRGFTIIELIVALGLFIVVSLVSIGSLISIIDVNRKTQATKSVLNNLNFALEGLTKAARVSYSFHCSPASAVPGNIDQPKDCPAGGGLFAFEADSGDPNNKTDQVVYRLQNGQIERSLFGGANGTFIGVTAPEVSITSLRFFVIGASRTDNLQPRVIIVARGQADFGGKAVTDFNIQTTVSQRSIDE